MSAGREWRRATLFCYQDVAMKDEILKVAEEAAEFLGFSVYEFHVLLKGPSTNISVKIDSPDGISHDKCAEFSDEFCGRMEDLNLLPNFSLEVSSPGLNRKLRTPEEFIRFKDAPVKVSYMEDGEKRFSMGILTDADENRIELLDENKKRVLVEYSNITNANLNY